MEGAFISNLRPYLYPYYQKTTIEELVQEMLRSGTIRPSVSPYVSPPCEEEGWKLEVLHGLQCLQ